MDPWAQKHSVNVVLHSAPMRNLIKFQIPEIRPSQVELIYFKDSKNKFHVILWNKALIYQPGGIANLAQSKLFISYASLQVDYMPVFPGFDAKYFLNPWTIPFHPMKVLFKGYEIQSNFWWGHCAWSTWEHMKYLMPNFSFKYPWSPIKLLTVIMVPFANLLGPKVVFSM